MSDIFSEGEDRRLFEHLLELGCCKLCCLRYLGERSADAYRCPVDALTKRNLLAAPDADGNPCKLRKTNVCVACLGLLQEGLRDSVIAKVIADVKDTDYDCKEFFCSLSMPVSFSLRTHSLNLHLMSKFPGIANNVEDLQFVSVKDVWKWIAAEDIGKGIHKKFNPKDCDFYITIGITYENDEKECSCLINMHKETFDVRRKQKRKFKDSFLSRKATESLLLSTEPEHFRKHYPTPPDLSSVPIVCSSVSLLHNSIFVAGRYNKFSRTLCQTPWIINGERTMENSVQEFICNPLKDLVRAQDLRFASSGREDVDVRMLGKGRPFYCELINPRRVQLKPQHFRAIEKSISLTTKEVSVRHLQKVSKDEVSKVKAGEENKVKIYNAYCIVLGQNVSVDWEKLQSLPSKCPIALKQKTPIRVLHRRNLATRERSIFRMEINKPDTDEPRAFLMKLTTQAGTYVKEFVHGDFGRTFPSLKDLLGCDVDILALDVLDIELDWPPEVNYNNQVDNL